MKDLSICFFEKNGAGYYSGCRGGKREGDSERREAKGRWIGGRGWCRMVKIVMNRGTEALEREAQRGGGTITFNLPFFPRSTSPEQRRTENAFASRP